MAEKGKWYSGLKGTNFIWLTVAGIINAVGITLLLSPVTLYDSGVSGLSMFIGDLTPVFLPMALFLVVINVPIFLFGYRRQGAAFTIYSIYAILIYSLAALVVDLAFPESWFLDELGNSVSPITGDALLLCSIFGGLLSGIGSGMTIRFGGTMDGIETLAVIFAKRLNLTVGNFVMIFNIILYVAIGATYAGMGHSDAFIIPLYSIIAYFVNGMAVDFIAEGLDKQKGALIVTDKIDEVASALSDEFGRGLTIMDGKGYYSGADKKIIYCVVNRFQVAHMHSIIAEHDPHAFVTVMEISDVYGTSVKGRITSRRARKRLKEEKLKAAAVAAANAELTSRGEEPIVVDIPYDAGDATLNTETAADMPEENDVPKTSSDDNIDLSDCESGGLSPEDSDKEVEAESKPEKGEGE